MLAAATRQRAIPIMLLAFVVLCSGAIPAPRMAFLQMERGNVAFTTGRAMLDHALESEFRWLKSTQRPDGAITLNAERNRVIPYFANLAALPLLDRDPGAVRLYMEWYLERLNMPDRFGLYGTIYDRYYHNGVERTTEDYDSADSYAATFLSLVRAYQVKTNDNGWVREHLDELKTIAQVILALQDSDGLVWAKPNHKMKYLMDNSENYRGLLDWSLVLKDIGHVADAAYYEQKAEMVREGIEAKLWDERRQMYLWGAGRMIKRVPRTGTWYPDNVSQIYPIVFGVIPPDSARARELYRRLNEQFPDWPEYAKDDPFPWTIMAYAAAKVGDLERAARFLDMTDSLFIRTGRPEPWHSMESAFYLLTCQTVDTNLGTALK